MRILALMAAFALVSIAPVQAGEGRSLSLSGVDQKLPGSLGKAAETPKLVEAPKPPDPPKPPETPKAETPAAAAPAQAVVGAKCGLATTSLVLGILSIIPCGFLTGLPAIITGHIARSKIKQSGGAPR